MRIKHDLPARRWVVQVAILFAALVAFLIGTLPAHAATLDPAEQERSANPPKAGDPPWMDTDTEEVIPDPHSLQPGYVYEPIAKNWKIAKTDPRSWA